MQRLGERAARAVLLLIVISTALRLLLAATVGLSTDESYTVAISRHLALSYFDHPPLHIWLVGAWARLIGSEAPVLVRLPFIALFALSSWLLYRLSALAFGERSGWWAAVVLNIMPQLTLATASWVLPDGPLVCCSLLTVWSVAQALRQSPQRRGAWGWWLLAGLAAGLALLSKYLAVFLLAGLFGYLLSSRDRRWLRTPMPWVGLLLALALFSPVLIWNAEHHWVSFAFQGGRALPVHWSVARLGVDFAGQVAYLLPWTAAALIWVLWRAWRAGPRDTAAWLFLWLASVPVVFFTLLALRTTVLPHWPMPGWLFAVPLLGRALAQLEQSRPQLVRGCTAATAALLVGLLGVAASQARSGWIDRYAPGFGRSDPTVDLLDWRTLGPTLAHRGLLRAGMPVAAVSWIDAGKIDYALAGRAVVLCLGRDPRQFAFLHDPQEFTGEQALIVANARRRDWLQNAAPYFRRIEPLSDVIVRRAGEPVLVLKVARGIGLRSAAR